MTDELKRCPSCELLFSQQDEPNGSFKQLYDDYIKLRQERDRKKKTFRIVQKSPAMHILPGTFTDKELAQTIAGVYARMNDDCRYQVLEEVVMFGRRTILDPECPEDYWIAIPNG